MKRLMRSVLVAARVLIGRWGPTRRMEAASRNEYATAMAAAAAKRTPRRLPVLALGPDSSARLRRLM